MGITTNRPIPYPGKRIVSTYLKWKYSNIHVIYQMGKIGSASIYDALNQAGHEVMHVHNLQGYSSGASDLQRRLESLKPNPIESYQRVIKANLLRHSARMGLGSRKNKIKIITGIREPIALNISRFFQDLSAFTLDYLNGYSNRESKWNELDSGVIFLENAFNFTVRHEYPISWFDREFKKTLGVDIYQYDFDKKIGYSVIKKSGYEIFIYRTENLFDSNLVKALCDFTETDVRIGNKNSASDRWYKDVYVNFKKQYRPSKTILDTLYQSKCIRHFYSTTEIDGFYKKYS